MKTNINRIRNDIEELSKFNEAVGMGLTRLSFTKEDFGAREYIKSEMRKAGLRVYEDAAGTIVGRLDGEIKDAPVVMIGSHYDSVRNGGNFDGPAGVVTALEVARVINESNIRLKFPVEFVAMIEEEGARFGKGLFASRAMTGKVSRDELDTSKDINGINLAAAMKSFGFDPDKIHEAVRESEKVRAFLELHIEQGPVLENEVKDIGIVEYVVGICQIEVTVKGRPDHAGTTPMNMRIDALDASAQLISKISSFANRAGEGTVATVGIINISPGSSNIVPGEVKFTVDIRSKEQESINYVVGEIKKEIEQISHKSKIKYSIEEKLSVLPVKLNEKIIEDFQNICDELGLSKKNMLSGAGHDAMVMASITNVGLIFVKSKDGRSHCPEEWTEYEDLQKGIEVMYHEVLNLAGVI
ncbi:allantoate amidohydrolase [Clostridium sp. JNZ J1-5]